MIIDRVPAHCRRRRVCPTAKLAWARRVTVHRSQQSHRSHMFSIDPCRPFHSMKRNYTHKPINRIKKLLIP